MNRMFMLVERLAVVLIAALLLWGFSAETNAAIEGMLPTSVDLSGNPVFHLTARCDFISTADGGSVLIWGYAPGQPADNNRAQYPGPTLIVQEGETVTVVLHNQLTDEGENLLDGIANPKAVNVSAVFQGQRMESVTGSPGVPGLITREAEAGASVQYSFIASQPGTFQYHSGTDTALQVELGLLGAVIVRPLMGNSYAYNHSESYFDREVLFLLTEMDPAIHDMVEFEQWDQIDLTSTFPVYWFINGRTAPDTMGPAYAMWLPTQPYNCMPRAMPGEKLLMRVIGAGRDLHPFHHHGNHARTIARDGRPLLSSAAAATIDHSFEVFTIQSVPGETVDAIFSWSGKNLGWDIYGDPADPDFAHTCTDGDSDGFDDATHEWCADHGEPIPVELPNSLDLTFGGFWSGSPYLGAEGALPPGEGGLNPNSGLAFMWHSHTEKEMVNFDIFPGGMMTMFMVEPPGTFAGPETPVIPR
jgi:hypothetical protein